MKPSPHRFLTAPCIGQSIRRWLLLGWMGVLAATSSLGAETQRIHSDTTWRAMGPLGNLEGHPINSVGRAWEAAHPGWNTNLDFDDTEAAGWKAAIISPLSKTPVGSTNSIWVDGNGYNGSSPAYFRKTFTICGKVSSAEMDLGIDDDAQVYLNGVLVLDDHNGHSDSFSNLDVASHLVEGQNLIAIKAHDSFGIGEQLALHLTIELSR